MHDDILERTGGERGILHTGPITSAIERARWGPFEHGGALSERAAFLLRGIVQDHPFVDGNKRTAFEAMETFLRRNGFALDISDEEGIDQMLKIARGERGKEAITRWIQANLRRR